MEVRLESWAGSNYRCWPSFVVAPPKKGVVIVRGRNLDSGTSSGAGKTSLLAAISSVMGCGPPATKAQAWGAKRYDLTASFSLNGEPLILSRGSGKFKMAALEGTLAEERLVQLFGHPKVLAPLTWRQQRRRGHFFAKTASERAAFLAEVLDLGRFERVGRAAMTAASKAEGEAAFLRRSLAQGEAALEAVPPEPIRQSLPDLAQAEAVLAGLEAEHASRQSATEAALSLFEERATKISKLDGLISKLRGEVSRLERECLVAAGRCPTCGTEFESRPDPVKELALASLREDLESAIEARSAIPSLVRPPQQDATRLLGARRFVAELRDRHREADRIFERATAAREQAVTAAARAAQRAAAMRQQISEHEQAAAREGDLSLWEKSWRTHFGAELLADITQATNDILSRIPNTSSVTVEFSAKETASGQEVSDAVMVDGVEREDGLSEGQKSSVELACDLALRHVVGGRCERRPAWLVLDEPFEGMGLPDREAFLEWMEEQDDLFLVVDTHSREFSELFERQGIGVEMSGGVSRIVGDEERMSW